MRNIIIALCAVLLLCTCSTTPKEDPFSVKLDSPRFEAGSAEVYLDGFMSIGGLKENDITVYYYPTEDAVCLHFKVQFVDCNQFWDRAGRDAFISGLEQFKDDYIQRKLVKGKKSEKAYDSVMGFFAWKKTVMGVQARSTPRIDIGYSLRDGKAFFTTVQRESYYEDPITRSRNETSAVVRMHFTRAQADALAALFDEGSLRGLVPAGSNSNKPQQMDEYSF